MKKTLFDFLNYSKEKAEQAAFAQLIAGQITCNSLTVNHYFQLGGFVARYDTVKDLKDDTVVLTLEKLK